MLTSTTTCATRAGSTFIDTPLLPAEAAELLQVTEDELLAAAYEGEIQGVRLGSAWRFPLSNVLRAAANQAA